ncbi:MAG: ABC transporter permease [Nitrososphaerota archaeon]|jgi:putative ABC transport system permease protein|nr:ABC transporter permease [Nitrososphaerota archaeon]
MKTFDILGYSFSTIRLRKLRAALTTLGITIGILAIVAMLTITQGFQVAVTDELNSGLSTNSLIVTPGSSQGGSEGGVTISLDDSGFKLYLNDTSDIQNLSPDIDSVLAVISKVGMVESDYLNSSVHVYGVDYETYARIYSTFDAESGTIPTNPKNDTIVIGSSVSDPDKNGTQFIVPGDSINLVWLNVSARPFENKTYTAQVSGVLGAVGGFGFGGPSDSGVYIPLSTAESFFGTDVCDMIIVKLTNSDEDTIARVTDLIRDHFGNQVSVISSTAIISLLSTVFTTIQLFLFGIAAISLLVAGISIMNIMIVSLIERTREIGILKALGMKSRTVLMIFLGESVIIGFIGAILGIIGGWITAKAVVWVLGSGLIIGTGGGGLAITPVLTPIVLFGSLAFGVGISVIFALYPAWRASKLKPVDALRQD